LLYSTIGGQGTPSERPVAHPASKFVAIARATSRRLELITSDLDRLSHALDTLGVAAGLPGSEQDGSDSHRRGEPPEEGQHMAN
jgi:hypothetical protein